MKKQIKFWNITKVISSLICATMLVPLVACGNDDGAVSPADPGAESSGQEASANNYGDDEIVDFVKASQTTRTRSTRIP